MAGNQMGLGMMLSQIGNNMANWGEQKREREQQAMQRALQQRQLELAEKKAEEDRLEREAADQHRRFERAFSMNNSLPGGTPLSPEIVKDWEEIGMGPFIAPGKKEEFSVPNIHGMPSPLVGINGPARSIATAPPGLRQTELTNSRLTGQHEDTMAYRAEQLRLKGLADQNSATASLIRALAAQTAANTGQQNSRQNSGNMNFDNIIAARKQAAAEANQWVPPDTIMGDPAKSAEWERIYKEKLNELMGLVNAPASGGGNKSGIF